MHSAGPCLHSTPSLSVGLLLSEPASTQIEENLRADKR
jgi:hypothetical protein